MPKRLHSAKISLILTVLFMAAGSGSLSLIPLTTARDTGADRILTLVIAAVFWLGFAASVGMSFVTRQILAKYREKLLSRGVIPDQKLPGILRLSLQPESLVLYGIAAVGAVLILADILCRFIPTAVMCPILSVTLFAVSLHCVVDGKYYKVYKLIQGAYKR